MHIEQELQEVKELAKRLSGIIEAQQGKIDKLESELQFLRGGYNRAILGKGSERKGYPWDDSSNS